MLDEEGCGRFAGSGDSPGMVVLDYGYDRCCVGRYSHQLRAGHRGFPLFVVADLPINTYNSPREAAPQRPARNSDDGSAG